MVRNIFTLSFPLALAGFAGAATFYYNQVGYDAGQPFTVIVKSDAQLDEAEFSLMSNGSAVKTGKLSKGTNPDNWLNSGKFYTASLDGDVAPGTYKLQINENGQPQESGEFKVEKNALAQNTLASVLNYFYEDRADNSQIMDWDSKVQVYGSQGKTRDVRGGWYDASGDVSKYLSHLSYANNLNPQQIPLTVWSLAYAAEHIPAMLASASTKAKTDEEAVYGADFLVRMLDDEGFFYMTVFDNWGAGSRYLCAFTGSDGVKSADYKAAFREGGGMAIAALARASKLSVHGEFTNEQYLAAAKKGFEHLQGKQSIGGNCEYCDDNKENIIDDYTALLAATELYIATEKVDYLKDARARAKNLINRLSDDGYFWSDDAKTRPFWHASDAGLPLVALVRYAEVESKITMNSPSELIDWYCVDMIGASCYNYNAKDALDAIKAHLEWLVKVTNETENPFGYARQTYKTQNAIKNGFFIPHDNESNYWWQGESARIASLAAASVTAARMLQNRGFTDSASVYKYATDQFDWILGKNPYSTCMMYKKGVKNPKIYDGQSNYDETLEGGIANGITGKNKDGSGIAWDDDGVGAVGFDAMMESWQNWRWIEQWLPHSTWYLMALVARYDENPVVIEAPEQPEGIAKTRVLANAFDVSVSGLNLMVSLPTDSRGKVSAQTVRVLDLSGAQVVSVPVSGNRVNVRLPQGMNGVYMVQVPGLGVRKIVVR